MRSVENKKAWMAMAVLSAAVAMSTRAQAQSTYTWDSSGANPSAPVDGSGNWNLSTADWSKGSSDVVWPNDTSIAAFGSSGTAGAVTVQSAVNAGALLFNPITSGTYTIAGSNTVTLVGNAAIGVLTNANISAPISGSLGLLFGGTGTLNLSGASTYTGATVLDSSTLQLGAAGTLPATTTVTVNSGATLDTNNLTQTVASLAGAGNVLLESGSNLTLNQTSTTVFSGTLSGNGTLTKNNTGTLTLTTPQTSFTGELLFNDTVSSANNQLVLSGNANVNNSTIVVNNKVTSGGGPELSLSNLATALTAPINFTPGPGGFRFTINAAAGTNEMISSPIAANFSSSAPQLIFISNTGGGNLAISSSVTVPGTATGGLIVFRGALSESFSGSISAPSGVAVATTDAGSCLFNPQPGSTWGETQLGGTYTLQIPNDSAITDGTPIAGASNSLQFGGGKLQLVNYTSNLSFVQANMSAATTALNLGAATGAASTFAGSVTFNDATNPVNFIGPGTLLLNGSINYPSNTVGTITISGGTLQLGNSNPFPTNATPTISAGATLDLNGQNLEVKAISGAGNIILTGSGSSLQLDTSAGTLSGAISGAGELIEATGALTLSGNNSYSGGTIIASASTTLTVGSATALGTGDVDNFGTLAIGTFSPTLGSLEGSGSTVTGSGNLTVGSDNNNETYSGAIKTTGSLTVVGTGTFTLGGSVANTYTGATNVNSGTLQLAAGINNVLTTTTALSVATGATFDMNGQSQQVASIAGAGSIINTGALTIGGSASTTFSGTMSSGGSLTFASTASGTLTINSDAAVGGSSANVSFASGSTAILKFSNYTSNLSFNNSGNVILGASTGAVSTLTGAVTGSGSLTYTGPGVLIFTSTNNNYSGGTTITGGNLQFGAGAFPGGSITLTAGALNISGAFPTVISALPSITTTSVGIVALTGDDSENIDFTANGGYANLFLGATKNSNYTGTITPANGTYNLGGGGATLTLPNDNVITGANNLAVANGTVALTGNNTSFTGAITLTSGALAIASDAAINNAAGGITFNGGTLQFNNYATNLSVLNSIASPKLGAASGTPATLNVPLTAATSLTYQGPGTLLIGSGVTLPATLALTVNAGTLDLNGASQTVGSLTGAGTIATESGTTLSLGSSTVTTASNTTYSGSITGAGGLTKNNAGTLTLTGNNTLIGPINLNQYSSTAVTGITLSGANASINSASSLTLANITSPGNSSFVPTLTLTSIGSAVMLPINVTLTATGDDRATLVNTAGANTVSGHITYTTTDTSASTLNFYSNAGTFTVSSEVTVSGPKPQITFRGTGTGVEGIFTGTIDGSGVANLIVGKTDPNTWVLDPTVGSTWGANTLAGGTWQMGRANVLPPTIVMPLSGGSTFDLNGFDQTVTGLTSAAGSEIVTSSTTAANLSIIVPATGNDTFGSATSDSISGPLTITIAGTGTGTETFAEPNTYTGGTNLNGGTLVFSVLTDLGTGPISFNGGTLNYATTSNTADLTTHGLTINSGGATINIGTNTVTFANAISGGGPLTKSGAGSLTLNAPQSLGGLTVSAGTLHLAAAGNAIAGTLAINGSSTVQIDGNTTAGKLSGDGTGTLKITAGKVATTAQGQSTLALVSLSIAPGAVLDLDNGNLAINYGAGADPYFTIIAEIKNGYDRGTWDGGTPVTGSIISSAAAANNATALAYADNTTSHQVQVKYTWYGDLNLDGVVNSTDLGLMSLSGSTWGTGDLNYDGIVNADDFALLMLGAASQNGTISAGVPEPTTAALALLPLAAGCVSRRRRQN